MKDNFRINILDYIKLVCAYFVIALHTISSNGINFYFKLIGRVGVPVFAICSGFLIENKISMNTKDNNRYIYRYCYRLLYLEIIWSIPYLLLDYDLYFTETIWYKNIYNVLIVFWKRGISSHLWYLSAVIICVCLLYILIPRMNRIYILIISSCLYVFCLFGDNYYGLIKNTIIAHIIDWYIIHFGNVWNSFISILLFVYIGVLVREKWEQKILPNFSIKLVSIFLVLFYLENIILCASGISRDNSASIALIPLSISIVIVGLRFSDKVIQPLVFTKASMYIYLVHVLVIKIVDYLWVYSGDFITSWRRFFIVSIVSTSVSVFLCMIERLFLKNKKVNKLKVRKKEYNE